MEITAKEKWTICFLILIFIPLVYMDITEIEVSFSEWSIYAGVYCFPSLVFSLFIYLLNRKRSFINILFPLMIVIGVLLLAGQGYRTEL
jgi:hypothetical protein